MHGSRDEKEGISPQDMVNRIAELINDQIIANGGDSINLSDVMPQLISIGATKSDVDRTVEEYANLGVWFRLGSDAIKLVDPLVDDE